jgi:hypothetical protein
MAGLRLQIRLFVGVFYCGISLVHVYAYAYLNPHPVRKGRSFLPQRAVTSVTVPVFHRYNNRHSQPSVLFSAPIPIPIDGDDNNVPVTNDVDLELHLEPSSLSLQDLIARLDERNIRYSPTSTRKDLETLLLEQSQQQLLVEQTQTGTSQSEVPNPPAFDEISSSPAAAAPQKQQSQRRQRPIQDILRELDQQSIRYPPTASRDDLEWLLENHRGSTEHKENAEASRTGTSTSSNMPITNTNTNTTSSSTTSQAKRPIPIADLVRELEERNIRYPPTATRLDLEELVAVQRAVATPAQDNASSQQWRQTETSPSKETEPGRDPITGGDGNDTQEPGQQVPSPPPASVPQNQQTRTPLVDVLLELDERKILFPPTATRKDLEELLVQRTRAAEAQDNSRSQQRQRQRQTETPPPIETELQRDPDMKRNGKNTQELGKQASSPPAASPRKKRQAKRKIADLLRELDERNIRYPPTATRLDLEELLVQRRQTETPPPLDTELSQRQQKPAPRDLYEQQLTPRAQRRAKLQKQQEQSPWRKILRKSQTVIPVAVWETLPNKIASTTSRATRKARRVSRQAAELFTVNVDEDGVRDVDYEYLYKEERTPKLPVDVTAQRITTEETEPYPRRQRRGPRDPATTPAPKRRQRDRDRPARARPVRTRSSRGVAPPAPPQNQPQQPLQTGFLLPPATKLDGSSNPVFSKSEQGPRKAPRSTRRDASSKRPKRRIYSPYKEESTIEDDRDVVDRFGDFFADAADRVFWDDYDGSATPKKRSKNKSAASAKNKTEAVARHWKDRLEERFDSMLGIHEDGALYNKWEQQMAEDRRNEGGNDAFSVAQGLKPKPRGVFGRRRKYDKPIWEEEGNLISLLFGRSSSGGSLLFERLLDHNSGSLLNFFESVLRSFLLVASYLSRWATVRGAIPQPLVVFGLISAGICARPRRRLRTIAITLLALRTAGELVHGYVFGEQGWEDEEDYEDEDVDLQGGEGERL